MKSKTTLYLDLDGTLLGSHRGFLTAGFIFGFTSWTIAQGHNPWPRLKALGQIQEAMEGGLAREKASTMRRGAAQVFAKALGIPPAQAEAELLSSARFAFKNLRFAFFKKHDALGFLEWARGKFELILATNPFWPLDVVEMRMNWGGVDPKLFRLITHNDNMSSCKPDQGYYHELLEKTGKDPQECLMVGNDYRKDSPAQKAGIDVFLLSTLPRQKALWDKEGLYSGSFDDLQELLTRKPLVRDS